MAFRGCGGLPTFVRLPRPQDCPPRYAGLVNSILHSLSRAVPAPMPLVPIAAGPVSWHAKAGRRRERDK